MNCKQRKLKDKIVFIIFMVLSFAILYYVWVKFPNILNKYEGYANEAEAPSSKVALETIKYIQPVLYINIALIIGYFLLNVKGFNRFVLPMMLSTICSTLLYMNIAKHGSAAGWLMIIGFFPMIGLLFIAFCIGLILDSKYTNKKLSDYFKMPNQLK